ncbi:FIST signal transduction protein [Thalassotalea euphylliae]|uniref:Histidine kinase n=1 Tax=Thalassotalea euphylliae TaxID=1655234 RepID=A0A3E0UCK7_9GAMM|nr:FIST N-terminal domain-containing protein [Thalassotalea euphylliae]REL34323.1 hypothetical protein DXX92_02580 [Thalassotalea euphylliae]
MKTFQSIYRASAWSTPLVQHSPAQLVMAYGNRDFALDQTLYAELQESFPDAQIVGCTTSGEIQGAQLHDDTLCLTAIEFDRVNVEVFSQLVSDFDNSFQLGQALARGIPAQGLKHAFVISDGQAINGSELIAGISGVLPENVVVTGGLAGDAAKFQETIVWHNDRKASGLVVIVGLYGDALVVGHGHLGGWREFGPMREITRSEDNELFEIDGKPALELYKEFLGEHADNLPASALRFPLAMKTEQQEQPVVRTILNIDEQRQSMIFAGNMPEGASCQLMRANYDHLVDGAQDSAEQALTFFDQIEPQLAILISCVGRRLVLAQRVEEELEIVEETLPANCAMTGFYSYGEISPIVPAGRCGLHNQTMTITLLSELSSD